MHPYAYKIFELIFHSLPRTNWIFQSYGFPFISMIYRLLCFVEHNLFIPFFDEDLDVAVVLAIVHKSINDSLSLRVCLCGFFLLFLSRSHTQFIFISISFFPSLLLIFCPKIIKYVNASVPEMFEHVFILYTRSV